ncbi:MAG TPA: aminodeoxychorismate synthase component I, partial [Longimicrobiaceae bacterium]|nr:aminodeoxychorismate synthase component I [Longimicrobiaceae bacterium]
MNPAPTDLARFDALGPHGEGRSFVFRDEIEVIEAWAVAEVIPALQRVEHHVAQGLHAAGFVAYEAAPAFDPALAVRPADPRLPLLRFGIYRERAASAPPPAAGDEAFALGDWTPSISREAYDAAIRRIRAWIAAGDTYQVNHTFRLRAPFAGDDDALYARLVNAQRAAYCAHLRWDGVSVLSASPELFFRWADAELTLRPMKGTRPRGRWPAEDDALAAELAASPKDRAENLMIVDLLRNDAGRVAQIGSVQVPRLFEVERYETVHQMTSTIQARTAPGTGLTDVFRALFPCGSITGAPKVRTSQIIAELEDSPRGIYTGAIGFASPGEAVFNVGIRTLVIDRAGGTVELGVGSGITYDSAAADEYLECLSKAEFARRAANDFELLETLRWEPALGFVRREGHLARMRESARYFGFRMDDGEVNRALEDAVRSADGARRVRLTLARDGGVRAEAHPLTLDADAAPVRVAIAAEPVDSGDALLYHKTTRREPYARRAAARPDCGDVLLVNERGEVTESTIANVVVEIAARRW